MTARISFICLIGIWEVVIYTHPKLHNKFIIIFFVSSHLKLLKKKLLEETGEALSYSSLMTEQQ